MPGIGKLRLAARTASKRVTIMADLLAGARLDVDVVESLDDALAMMVHQIRVKLLGLEVATGLKKLVLPGIDFAAAKQMTVSVLKEIETGQLGYAIVSTLVKPAMLSK